VPKAWKHPHFKQKLFATGLKGIWIDQRRVHGTGQKGGNPGEGHINVKGWAQPGRDVSDIAQKG